MSYYQLSILMYLYLLIVNIKLTRPHLNQYIWPKSRRSLQIWNAVDKEHLQTVFPEPNNKLLWINAAKNRVKNYHQILQNEKQRACLSRICKLANLTTATSHRCKQRSYAISSTPLYSNSTEAAAQNQRKKMSWQNKRLDLSWFNLPTTIYDCLQMIDPTILFITECTLFIMFIIHYSIKIPIYLK